MRLAGLGAEGSARGEGSLKHHTGAGGEGAQAGRARVIGGETARSNSGLRR